MLQRKVTPEANKGTGDITGSIATLGPHPVQDPGRGES